MKKIVITTLAGGTLAAAALGLAGSAGAFPNSGTAADVISGLRAEGYRVQVNGTTNNSPLSDCSVTDINPLLKESATPEEKANTRVLVDISCPTRH